MTTEYAENPSTELARRRLAEDRKLGERIRADYAERMRGKPTPTQEENDMAACGAHILTHEDDGSGPDPFQTRHMEAGHGAPYQTRQGTAQHRPQQPRTPPPRPE